MFLNLHRNFVAYEMMRNYVGANLSPSALAAGQGNGRDACVPSHECWHYGGQWPPVADAEETSAQDDKKPGDWLHTDELAGLQLEEPHKPA